MDYLALNDFSHVIWLLPVVVLLHVLEELPRFSDWATSQLGLPYTRRKFISENVVLFVILIASVALAALCPVTTLAGQVGVVMVLSAAVSLMSNVLFHGWLTLRSGIYSPGTVTACLLFAPLSIQLFRLADGEGLLTLRIGVLSVVIGLSLLPIVIAVVHRVIDRRIQPKSLLLLALIGLLPAVPISVARLVFDVDMAVLHKIMIYGGPLALLPLVVRAARRRTEANGETK